MVIIETIVPYLVQQWNACRKLESSGYNDMQKSRVSKYDDMQQSRVSKYATGYTRKWAKVLRGVSLR